ncbi:hypothetical protein SAZ11_52795 [Streptomyces sp. FXJ1.4098]|nr:hypothetical protein [Streptomyces sp. FXJ1.4098]
MTADEIRPGATRLLAHVLPEPDTGHATAAALPAELMAVPRAGCRTSWCPRRSSWWTSCR